MTDVLTWLRQQMPPDRRPPPPNPRDVARAMDLDPDHALWARWLVVTKRVTDAKRGDE